jgi:uncharacterized protein YdaL
LALIASSSIFGIAALTQPDLSGGQHWPDTDISREHWPAAALQAPLAPSGTAPALVLYDDLGAYQPLSQVYGTLATALASHFGAPEKHGVSTYTAGEMRAYRGVVYIGSDAGLTLPRAFLADVRSAGTPVLWMGANLDELAGPSGDLTGPYGWTWAPEDARPVRQVMYKSTALSRSPDAGPNSEVTITDPSRAQALATSVHDDGSTAAWAARSGNLTYVTEVALDAGDATGDRHLALCDLLFDLLQSDAISRHRALLRLEDISPMSDPDELRQTADVLSSAHVPFSIALYPVSVDALDQHPRKTVRLADRPEVVQAIAYMLRHGGTMVLHGYSHQFADLRNPDTGGSGADFEFCRVHRAGDGTLVYDSPVPGDSKVWATKRLQAANDEITKTGLPAPHILNFPHYCASGADYDAARELFEARFDRPQYLSTAWKTGPMNPFQFAQYAPYVVRDGYGSIVIPENLGYIKGPPIPPNGVGSLQSIVHGAAQSLVVRDGVASFFYHPYLGTEGLMFIVDRLRVLGYEFVSPSQL